MGDRNRYRKQKGRGREVVREGVEVGREKGLKQGERVIEYSGLCRTMMAVKTPLPRKGKAENVNT